MQIITLFTGDTLFSNTGLKNLIQFFFFLVPPPPNMMMVHLEIARWPRGSSISWHAQHLGFIPRLSLSKLGLAGMRENEMF